MPDANTPSPDLPSPQDVIGFWFAKEHRERWFDTTQAFDEECRVRFQPSTKAAAGGGLDHWKASPEGALAFILLLDQLTRNVFRGTAQAFAYDTIALDAARVAVAQGFDQQVEYDRRFFFYLPFEHSEVTADQVRSVELFEAYGEEVKLEYAVRHKVIIDRFGRFPHRNAILGRESTAEEVAFLKEPNSSF